MALIRHSTAFVARLLLFVLYPEVCELNGPLHVSETVLRGALERLAACCLGLLAPLEFLIPRLPLLLPPLLLLLFGQLRKVGNEVTGKLSQQGLLVEDRTSGLFHEQALLSLV